MNTDTNKITVNSTAFGSTVNEKSISACKIFTISSSENLEKSIPQKSPPKMEIAIMIRLSHSSTPARFHLPIPRILYKPNSFFLLLIKKEFV